MFSISPVLSLLFTIAIAVFGSTLYSNPRRLLQSLILVIQRLPCTLGSSKPLVNLAFPRRSDDQEVDEQLVMTKAELEGTYGLETWQRRVYNDFVNKMLSKTSSTPFPCIFAAKGYKSNDHRFVFINSDNPSSPQNVRRVGLALQIYHAMSKSCGLNTTMVLLCRPGKPRSVDEYTSEFWAFLRGLRKLDPKSWLEHIPRDTSSKDWTFCFDGATWFPLALTPGYVKRQSRYNPNLVYVFQPKWIFEILFSTPRKRGAAVDKVRKLLVRYDEVGLSPDLGPYGAEGFRESRQYCLLDENRSSDCPHADLG